MLSAVVVEAVELVDNRYAYGAVGWLLAECGQVCGKLVFHAAVHALSMSVPQRNAGYP